MATVSVEPPNIVSAAAFSKDGNACNIMVEEGPMMAAFDRVLASGAKPSTLVAVMLIASDNMTQIGAIDRIENVMVVIMEWTMKETVLCKCYCYCRNTKDLWGQELSLLPRTWSIDPSLWSAMDYSSTKYY